MTKDELLKVNWSKQLSESYAKLWNALTTEQRNKVKNSIVNGGEDSIADAIQKVEIYLADWSATMSGATKANWLSLTQAERDNRKLAALAGDVSTMADAVAKATGTSTTGTSTTGTSTTGTSTTGTSTTAGEKRIASAKAALNAPLMTIDARTGNVINGDKSYIGWIPISNLSNIQELDQNQLQENGIHHFGDGDYRQLVDTRNGNPVSLVITGLFSGSAGLTSIFDAPAINVSQAVLKQRAISATKPTAKTMADKYAEIKALQQAYSVEYNNIAQNGGAPWNGQGRALHGGEPGNVPGYGTLDWSIPGYYGFSLGSASSGVDNKDAVIKSLENAGAIYDPNSSADKYSRVWYVPADKLDSIVKPYSKDPHSGGLTEALVLGIIGAIAGAPGGLMHGIGNIVSGAGSTIADAGTGSVLSGAAGDAAVVGGTAGDSIVAGGVADAGAGSVVAGAGDSIVAGGAADAGAGSVVAGAGDAAGTFTEQLSAIQNAWEAGTLTTEQAISQISELNNVATGGGWADFITATGGQVDDLLTSVATRTAVDALVSKGVTEVAAKAVVEALGGGEKAITALDLAGKGTAGAGIIKKISDITGLDGDTIKTIGAGIVSGTGLLGALDSGDTTSTSVLTQTRAVPQWAIDRSRELAKPLDLLTVPTYQNFFGSTAPLSKTWQDLDTSTREGYLNTAGLKYALDNLELDSAKQGIISNAASAKVGAFGGARTGVYDATRLGELDKNKTYARGQAYTSAFDQYLKEQQQSQSDWNAGQTANINSVNTQNQNIIGANNSNISALGPIYQSANTTTTSTNTGNSGASWMTALAGALGTFGGLTGMFGSGKP